MTGIFVAIYRNRTSLEATSAASGNGIEDTAGIAGIESEKVRSESEIPFFAELEETFPAANKVPLRVLEKWTEALAISYKQVQSLRKESTEESLANLWDVEMFYTPGIMYTPDSFSDSSPPTGSVGNETIPRILSNRRALKLLFELSDMPKARADELVALWIEKSIPQYEERFRKEVLEDSRLTSADARPVSGLTYLTSNPRDGTPSLQGLRHSILALVYIAGALELDNRARAAVGVVLEKALEQRRMFYNAKASGWNTMLSADALTRASLYERHVLSVGIVGSGRLELDVNGLGIEQMPKGVRPSAVESMKNSDHLEVPPYTALTTPFESPSISSRKGSPLYIPPDYSQGKMEVPLYPFVDDTVFDALVKQWGVKGSGAS